MSSVFEVAKVHIRETRCMILVKFQAWKVLGEFYCRVKLSRKYLDFYQWGKHITTSLKIALCRDINVTRKQYK